MFLVGATFLCIMEKPVFYHFELRYRTEGINVCKCICDIYDMHVLYKLTHFHVFIVYKNPITTLIVHITFYSMFYACDYIVFSVLCQKWREWDDHWNRIT